MTVIDTEAKKTLTQLLVAVEKGQRVTIKRDGLVIAEIVRSSWRMIPQFGTLRGPVQMSTEQFGAATRPLTEEEVDAFLEGRY